MITNQGKFTIITVCRNSQDTIEETMESVIAQDYGNYDYIVVDGNSTDNTLEKAISIKEKCSKNIQIVSENDNGIYDAMNKGVRMINEGYIYFLNSGDTFYNNKVLRQVDEALSKNAADILYGDYIKISNIEKELIQSNEVSKFRFILDRMICHQAIFASIKTLNKSYNFNLEYRISSDFDWFIRCYKNEFKFLHIPLIICNYDMSGISGRSHNIIQKEHELIIRKNFGLIPMIISRIKHVIGNLLRKHSL